MSFAAAVGHDAAVAAAVAVVGLVPADANEWNDDGKCDATEAR